MKIKIWEKINKNQFKFKSELSGHQMWIWDCHFSIDSEYLVTCSSDKSIKLWSVSEEKQVSNLVCVRGVNKIILCDEESD